MSAPDPDVPATPTDPGIVDLADFDTGAELEMVSQPTAEELAAEVQKIREERGLIEKEPDPPPPFEYHGETMSQAPWDAKRVKEYDAVCTAADIAVADRVFLMRAFGVRFGEAPPSLAEADVWFTKMSELMRLDDARAAKLRTWGRTALFRGGA